MPSSRSLNRAVYSKQSRMCSLTPKDQKIHLHYDEVRGYFLGPPHMHLIPAAVKINKLLNEDPLDARKSHKI